MRFFRNPIIMAHARDALLLAWGALLWTEAAIPGSVRGLFSPHWLLIAAFAAAIPSARVIGLTTPLVALFLSATIWHSVPSIGPWRLPLALSLFLYGILSVLPHRAGGDPVRKDL